MDPSSPGSRVDRCDLSVLEPDLPLGPGPVLPPTPQPALLPMLSRSASCLTYTLLRRPASSLFCPRPCLPPRLRAVGSPSLGCLVCSSLRKCHDSSPSESVSPPLGAGWKCGRSSCLSGTCTAGLAWLRSAPRDHTANEPQPQPQQAPPGGDVFQGGESRSPASSVPASRHGREAIPAPQQLAQAGRLQMREDAA